MNISLLATASLGTSEFRIWVMQLNDGCQLSLRPHIKVDTSFTPGSGIRFLLEASTTQLVAVDTNRTVKFYEFIDKEMKEEKERNAKEEEEVIKGLKELFDRYDAD